MPIRQAIVTFDTARLLQADGAAIGELLRNALAGKAADQESGIIRIDLVGAGQSVYIGPEAGIDGQMTVS